MKLAHDIENTIKSINSPQKAALKNALQPSAVKHNLVVEGWHERIDRQTDEMHNKDLLHMLFDISIMTIADTMAMKQNEFNLNCSVVLGSVRFVGGLGV